MNLLQKQLNVIYPNRPNDVNFIAHFKDEGDRKDLKIAPCRRLLNGVMKINNLRRIVIGLDSNTTDNTEKILKEFKEKFEGEFVILPFKWKFDYSYAKNLCLDKLDEMGIQDGEWIMCRGGDFSMPDKFIEQYNKFSANKDNVVGRIYVPEWSPIKILNYISPTLKNMFPFLHEVHRDRIIDWRYRKDIRFRGRVHENMYQDFYILTHMGEYFSKHHGVPLIGTCFHHGKNEDSLELATWKIFNYIVLTQCDRIEGMYANTLLYELKNAKTYPEVIKIYEQIKGIFASGSEDMRNLIVMRDISQTPTQKEAMKLGWNEWVKYMTKYYHTSCPKELYDYHERIITSPNVIVPYG